MATHLSHGIWMPPREQMNLSAEHSSASPLSANYRSTLANANWRAAMTEEYRALMDNGTWTLVPRPPGVNVVSGKWILKHKHHSDGTLALHKARWVMRSYSQRPGFDYEETFSPIVKPATIWVVLSLAASCHWPIHQLNVKNAFLHQVLLTPQHLIMFAFYRILSTTSNKPRVHGTNVLRRT